MSIKKMKKTNTIHFGIQRKIVANMTTESWENIPHVTYNYEPDVTEFMIEYQRLNAGASPETKITLNTLMLKIITEGLKANPIMNSHIEFDKKLVRGEIHTFEDINISMPMVLPSGEMMTINLHNFEKKNLNEMVNYINDVNRRVANTDLNEVMFDVSMDNTINALKKGAIKQTLYRLIGSKTGKHKVKTLSGKAKREYYNIPEEDRLTKHDIEQGTITVSNIGSVYRNQRGETCLLEIVPPQVCAIALGAVQDKPVVVVNEQGEKEIAIRQIMPLCIAFDHRALDFGEIVPFLKKLDEIFEAPEIIHTWKDGGVEDVDMEVIKNERVERETKYQASKEREKARKEAEKAAEKAKREAEKAQRAAEKAVEKAQKEAEKAQKEAEEAAAKAEEKARKEAEKAEKEILEAEKKAQKEAEEAAAKEEDKAKKEAEKAEKEAREAEKKAQKEAERAKKEALEAEKKAQKEAYEKAKKDAERIKKDLEKAKRDIERKEKVKKEIEKARKDAEKAKAKAEEAKAKAEEAKIKAEEIKTKKALEEAEKAFEKAEKAAHEAEKAEEKVSEAEKENK